MNPIRAIEIFDAFQISNINTLSPKYFVIQMINYSEMLLQIFPFELKFTSK